MRRCLPKKSLDNFRINLSNLMIRLEALLVCHMTNLLVILSLAVYPFSNLSL